MKRLRWIAALLVALTCLPSLAGATQFSFGEILASQTITSLVVDPGPGGADTLVYDSGTQTLTIEGSVSKIFFASSATLEIPLGTVLFQSTVMLNTGPTLLPPVNPTFALAGFTNGVTSDWSITDTLGADGLGTTPIVMAYGNYDGDLQLQFQNQVAVIGGETTAAIDGVTGGDADFVSALGTVGTLENTFTIGTGLNLCGSVVSCTAGSSGFATGLTSFASNPNFTIQLVPEPGTALLVGLGLLGLAAQRRARQ